MEKQFSKEEILTNYLNEIYFSNQVYGIGAAATYYFDKSIHELSEAEMTFISAIPNNPTIFCMTLKKTMKQLKIGKNCSLMSW